VSWITTAKALRLAQNLLDVCLRTLREMHMPETELPPEFEQPSRLHDPRQQLPLEPPAEEPPRPTPELDEVSNPAPDPFLRRS
jgi:hypothetical protein